MDKERIKRISEDLAYHIVEHDNADVCDPETLAKIIKKFLTKQFKPFGDWQPVED